MNRMMKSTLVGLLALASTYAAGSPPPVADPASVHLSAMTVPFSSYASPQARQAFVDSLKALQTSPAPADLAGQRAFYGKFNDDMAAKQRAAYSVQVQHEVIGGVATDVVTPTAGIAKNNTDRVLINLHGGAFMWGSGSGALVESVPIAAVGRIKVVAVDYRLAPENLFPAASEDVAAVYKALLAHYRPENIGIFGCSAGGILTAEAVAWFQTHGLPRPGAIGTFCGSGNEFGGDSVQLADALNGKPAPAATAPGAPPPTAPYLAKAKRDDPLAYPAASAKVLAQFPPTLLIAGGRDFSASAVTTMHRQLVAQGVDAELFMFDGMWHAFFMNPDLPESRETYLIVTRFFDKHLGQSVTKH
jgi:epsilon-lactone hydrolase